MTVVNIHQAKTQLSALIARAERGEEILIARAGEPAVRLQPVNPATPRRQTGFAKGEFTVPDSFFDPLPEDAMEHFR